MNRMALSRVDLPLLAEAIRILYRVLERADADRSWMPDAAKETAWDLYAEPERMERVAVIDLAARLVLYRMMPSGVYQGSECPDITESNIDEKLRSLLLDLRGDLQNSFFAHRCATELSLALQVRVGLDDLLREWLPDYATPAAVRRASHVIDTAPRGQPGAPPIGSAGGRGGAMSDAAPDAFRELQTLISAARAEKDRSQEADAKAAAHRAEQDQVYNAVVAVAEFKAGDDPNWIETWSDRFLAAGVELNRFGLAAKLETLRYRGEDSGYKRGTEAAFRVYQLACAGRRTDVVDALKSLEDSQAVAGGAFRTFLCEVRNSIYPWTVADEPPAASSADSSAEPQKLPAPIGQLPEPPQSFVDLPQADRCRAQEVWRAAHQLREIIEVWQAWWRELRSTGTANAGAALGLRVAAGDAIDVLCRHRINAAPFDVVAPTELRAILPPVPDGRLAHECLELDGSGGTRRERSASWQERMRLEDGYYSSANDLPEAWGRSRSDAMGTLVGFLNALIRRLRNAPLSVVAGATPTPETERLASRNVVPSGRTDGTNRADQESESGNSNSNPRHLKGGAQAKLEGALLTHHGYFDGGCKTFKPIKPSKLVSDLGVGKATVSDFFKKAFGENRYDDYVAACRDRTRLCAKLKIMARDYTDTPTYGRTPPGEGRDEDE
jgi:hypothetical protein